MAGDKIFLGIDGGGTRSTAVAADDQGNIIAKVTGKTINYYAVGMEDAQFNLSAIVQRLASEFGITEYECVYIGMSALNQEADTKLTRCFIGSIVRAKAIYMHSDAYIALNALTQAKQGMLIISGTGSTAVAKDETGRYLHVGGWGYILGDQGSAYDIALKALRAAVKAQDRTGAATSLYNAVQSYFNINTLTELVDHIHNPPIERHDLAGFAIHVYESAQSGDATALHILHEAANDLAEHVDTLMNRMKLNRTTIGVYGGVLLNNHYVFERFRTLVLNKYPLCEVKVPEHPPEIGAILCCFGKMGLDITANIYEKLKLYECKEMINGGVSP